MRSDSPRTSLTNASFGLLATEVIFLLLSVPGCQELDWEFSDYAEFVMLNEMLIILGWTLIVRNAHPSALQSINSGLRAVIHIQFVQYRGHMIFDRLMADP